MKQPQTQAEIYSIDNDGHGTYQTNGGCPTSSSSAPQSVFESEQFFKILSSLATQLNIDLSNSELAECRISNTSFGVSLNARDFLKYEDSDFQDLILGNTDGSYTPCIDSSGSPISRLVTSHADDAGVPCEEDSYIF